MKKIIIAYAFLCATALVFAQSAAQVKTLDSALTYLHEREMFNGQHYLLKMGKFSIKSVRHG